jgi:excisionase family DNA binding protein
VEHADTPNGPPCVTVPSPRFVDMTGQAAPDPAPAELRPAEAQRLLGVSRTTLHDYEHSGRLTARRTLGGHRRYPVDQPAIQAALATQ